MSQTIDKNKIPEYVTRVTQTLADAGFEAFIVGGCVRDLIIGREPKDWDVTTNANPEQIQGLFEKTIYENTFGTVGVCIPMDFLPFTKGEMQEGVKVEEETKYHIIEVTPYRTETTYTDFRHPDEVKFSDNIEDDLKRRDFTMNAIAYNPITDILIDNYNGHTDIKDKAIKCVGEADDRFKEDALRMLRAIRFACELGFTVSYETMTAITENSALIDKVSRERIRDEFVKIINSPNPVIGIGMLQKFGLLKYIIPELEEGIGCDQGGAHVFDVFTHCVQALGHSAEKGWELEIRLSALFHDIGKPRSKREGKAKPVTNKHTSPASEKSGPRVKSPDHDFSHAGYAIKPTFYGHEVIGARMVAKIMERLKFSRETSEKVTKLVRYHMFFSDTEAITLSAVRRIIVNVTRENIWDLMNIRECDRVGMKKAEAPYRLRKYHAMIEECLRDPISVSQLKVDGNILMKELDIKPGPRMGYILNALLEEVLDDPTKNDRTYLDTRVSELNDLSDSALRSLANKAKNTKDKLEEEEVKELHKKHGV